MRADETHIHKFNSEFYYYYQTIVISFKIKHIMLIANIINTIKR